MNKLISLLLSMALALSLIAPASAYYADAFGCREDIPDVPHGFVELVADAITPQMDEPDEGESLTFEEKVEVNHDIEDERWFDVCDECRHPKTTVYPCYSPDEAFFQKECAVCGLILDEWEMDAEEDLGDCPDDVDPNDYPEEDEEITNEEAWVPEEVGEQ